MPMVGGLGFGRETEGGAEGGWGTGEGLRDIDDGGSLAGSFDVSGQSFELRCGLTYSIQLPFLG